MVILPMPPHPHDIPEIDNALPAARIPSPRQPSGRPLTLVISRAHNLFFSSGRHEGGCKVACIHRGNWPTGAEAGAGQISSWEGGGELDGAVCGTGTGFFGPFFFLFLFWLMALVQWGSLRSCEIRRQWMRVDLSCRFPSAGISSCDPTVCVTTAPLHHHPT